MYLVSGVNNGIPEVHEENPFISGELMEIDSILIISIVTSVTALLAGVGAIIKAAKTPVGQNATIAEQYQGISKRAMAECEEMRNEVDRLRVQLGEFEIKVADYEHGVGLLIQQLRAQQIEPVWEPGKEN